MLSEGMVRGRGVFDFVSPVKVARQQHSHSESFMLVLMITKSRRVKKYKIESVIEAVEKIFTEDCFFGTLTRIS